MVIVEIPPITNERPTPPYPDRVQIEPGRPDRTMQSYPIPWPTLPSLDGDPVGRDWRAHSTLNVLGLRSGLYEGIPVAELDPSGAWVVRNEYLKTGSTTDGAVKQFPKKPRWPGGPGTCMVAGNMMVTPRADGFRCVDVGGWMFDLMPDGLGPKHVTGWWMRPGDPILTDGRGMVLDGVFDTPWKGANDLCMEWGSDQVTYVADSLNGRLTRTARVDNRWRTETFLGGQGRLDSVIALPDGTLVTVDRTGGRVLAAHPSRPGQAQEITRNLDGPAWVRAYHDGRLVVGEWSGARRLMEVGLDGSQRAHSLVRTMNGVQTTAWFAFDIDREGTCGPRDDIGLTIYSSDAMVQRRGREGFMGQWLEKGKGSYLAQGPMRLVSDPTGHYPWMWVFHDKWAWGLMTGDAGTNHVALLYLRQPEHAQPEQFDVALYKRGRDVWQYGTTPESGEEVPSFRLSMGRHGAHRLGGMATNDLARLSAADCAAHLKAGGRGMTPRLKLTDADCFAAQYAVYCHSDLAVYNLSPSAIGTPPPPPDSTGPVLTATGWPAGPVTVGNRLELDVAAQDPAGVAWVALYLDGAEVARDTALPYALVHELATPGEFLYSVAAEDTRGNRTVQAPRLVTVLPAPLPSQPDVTLYHKPGVTVEVKPYP